MGDCKADWMKKMSDCKGNWNPEEWKQKWENCAGDKQQWNFQGKHDWKVARAVCQRKPEEVLELVPGMTETIELDILNDTHWPWKPNSTLTLADEQPNDELPIEVFNLPVEQEVRGKATVTFSVPITIGQHVIADNEKVYEVHLTFRGPMGHAFGAIIPLKIKCVVAKPVTNVEIYKLAIKFHEQLNLGSLDDCIRVVRENNCDEAASIMAMQQRKN